MKNISVKAIIIVVIAVALLLFGVFTLMAQMSDNSTENKSTDTPEKQVIDFEYYEVGQEMKFPSVYATVNSFEYRDTISGVAGSKVASEGAKFLVVNLTETNQTSESMIHRDFKLIDAEGNLYEPYPETIGYLDEALRGKSLQPGVPLTGLVVYEVPLMATADEMRFGEERSSDGKHVFTKLK